MNFEDTTSYKTYLYEDGTEGPIEPEHQPVTSPVSFNDLLLQIKQQYDTITEMLERIEQSQSDTAYRVRRLEKLNGR